MKRLGIAYHRVHQRTQSRQASEAADTEKNKKGTDPGNNKKKLGSESNKKSIRTTAAERYSIVKAKIRRFKRRWDRISNETWTWELVGIFIGVSTLVSILGILAAYDQKPLPHSVAGISLNTAISILATVSRAATIFVAGSTIAQQNWLKFARSSHPLSSSPLYDDATRGPLGSLLLLFTLPRSLVTIAIALVTVLALGFEPFVQQSLKFPPKEIPVEGARPLLQTTRNVSYGGDISSDKSVEMSALFTQALYSDSIRPLEPACSASHCEWPSYVTAAVCSSCTDVTNQANISSDNSDALTAFATGRFMNDFQGIGNVSRGAYGMYDYSVATNYSIALGSRPPISVTANFIGSVSLDGDLMSSLTYPEEVLFDVSDIPPVVQGGGGAMWLINITGPLTTLGYVRLNRSSDRLRLEATSAQICTISMCARTQSSTVINGSVSNHVDQEIWGRYYSSYLEGGAGLGYAWTAELGSQHFDTINASFIFRLDEYVKGLTNYSIIELDAGYGLYGYEMFDRGYHASNSTTYPSANAMQFMADLGNSSAKIAQVFTNYLNQNGDINIPGEAYTVVPFVVVHWAWLSFPFTLVLICAITLVITIFQSRRRHLPTWKTSPYPFLFGYQYQRPEGKDMMVPVSPRADQEPSETGTPRTDQEPSEAETQRADQDPPEVEAQRPAQEPLEADTEEDGSSQEREGLQHTTTMPNPVGIEGGLTKYAEIADETLLRLTRREEGRWVFDQVT